MDPVQATMELQDTTQHSTRSSYEERLARIMSTSNSGRIKKPLNVTNKTFLNNDLSLPSFHDLSHLGREEEEQQDVGSVHTKLSSLGNSSGNHTNLLVSVEPAVLQMARENMDGHDEQDNESSTKRSSQLCLFVLCDLVTASVIMNGLYIAILVFHLVISLCYNSSWAIAIVLYPQDNIDYDDDAFKNYDDDNVQLVQLERQLSPWGVIRYVLNATGMLFAAFGIYGAIRFSKNWVLASAVFYIVYIVAYAVNLSWIGVFVSVPFLYTNLHLYLALRSRSISQENYNRERYCFIWNCLCCRQTCGTSNNSKSKSPHEMSPEP